MHPHSRGRHLWMTGLFVPIDLQTYAYSIPLFFAYAQSILLPFLATIRTGMIGAS
jgi:hypothetical protein